MDLTRKQKHIIWIILTLLAIWLFTPLGRFMGNRWIFQVKKTDDATNYETLKEVEDTCRAMIASYKADKLIFEQYRRSENEDAWEWAEQAKMRANRTAAQYNEYIRKNSFVWADNVPDDIDERLEYVE